MKNLIHILLILIASILVVSIASRLILNLINRPKSPPPSWDIDMQDLILARGIQSQPSPDTRGSTQPVPFWKELLAQTCIILILVFLLCL